MFNSSDLSVKIERNCRKVGQSLLEHKWRKIQGNNEKNLLQLQQIKNDETTYI